LGSLRRTTPLRNRVSCVALGNDQLRTVEQLIAERYVRMSTITHLEGPSALLDMPDTVSNAQMRDRTESMKKTAIFLVDDHEVVRRGIAQLVDAEPDLQAVGGAATVAEALDKISAVQPDVVVLDVRLPDGDGVGLCRELRSRHPEVRCLILTSFDDDDAMFDGLMAGAAGFLLKQGRGSDLVTAIRAVGYGQSSLPSSMVPRLLRRAGRQEQSDPLWQLSERERRVLKLIVDGLTNWEIAMRIHLAETTVKNCVSQLLDKLSMRNRVEIAVFATALRSNGDSGRHYIEE
jgi:two-component system response regulator DevR